ncbi:MAG TPA: GNAT family N-acetyltransferase, partial [Candidatus Binataceae bacterium]|nr:GNAT family N-acetyltransferase [Candidatus Binataceae bacterium]
NRQLDASAESAVPGTELPISFTPYLSREAVETIRSGIASHAHAAIGLPETEWFPHNFFLRDQEGEIVGGILGNVWAKWLYVDFLWVDRSIRGRGHASRLMRAAEQGAVARGCANSFLGTFSFQARPLYEKLGYHVFGEERDHPKGHSHYLLTRPLLGG